MAVARDDLAAAAGAAFDVAAWMVVATAHYEAVVAAVSLPRGHFRTPADRLVDAISELYRCAKTGRTARHVPVAVRADRGHSVSLRAGLGQRDGALGQCSGMTPERL
jgi:acyl-CoA hydrolase